MRTSTFPALQRVLAVSAELECAPVVMLKGRKKVVLRKGGRRWMEGSSMKEARNLQHVVGGPAG